MTIKRLLPVIFLLAVTSCTTDFESVEQIAERETREMFARRDAAQGVLNVKFSRETADALSISATRSGELSTGNITLDEICREYEVISIERIFPADRFEPRKRAAGLDLWYTVRVGGGRTAGETAVRLRKMDGILEVSPKIKVKRLGHGTARYLSEEEVSRLTSQTRSGAAGGFDDPLLPEQWMLKNIASESDYYGAYNFVAGADVNVESAWAKCGGNNDVIVAIVDGGIEYTHPDIAANMWSGIGYNYVLNNTKISAEEHGTHVAGTIAAVTNNGVGIAGIAGGLGRGDGVKLISCQIFTEDDSAYDSDCARAIAEGADNGAVISQNSWGYPIDYATSDNFATRLGVIKNAIDYFVDYAGMSEDGKTQVGPMAGGVVIFAAGNDGLEQNEYPASYEKCLSVAAMSGNYKATWYSTYSSAVDLLAPGGGGPTSSLDMPAWNLSTLPTSVKNGDTYEVDGKTYIVDYVRKSGYGYMCGTSMACPHVSGAAALIVSYCGGEGFTNTRLTELLLSTAKDVDSYQKAAHKGKVGKLIDISAALEAGGPGSIYTPVSHANITLLEGSSNLYLLPTEKSTLVFSLTNCDTIEVSDSRIKSNRTEDRLTLTVDASLLGEGIHKFVIKGCNNESETSFTINVTVEGILAKFYPNPCDEVLNIQLDKIKNEYKNCDARIRINNSLGATVIDRYTTFNGNKAVEVPVGNLNPGLYFVEVDVTFGDYSQTVKQTVVKR